MILLLAFALRVLTLDAQSLWYDEGNTAALVQRPFDRVVAGAAADIHPPGYYLIVAGWERAAGASEFSLRYPSLIFGMITAAALYAAARRIGGVRAAVWAGLLAALHPLLIWYAQEARMYALLGMCAALGLWLTLQVSDQLSAASLQWRKALPLWLGYLLVHALGMYTHYSFPFVIFAESLAVLVWAMAARRLPRATLIWGGLQAGTLLLFLPILRTALRQVFGWPNPLAPALPSTVISALGFGVTLDPAQGWVIATLAGATLLAGLALWRLPRAGRLLLALPIALLVSMPVLLMAMETLTDANLKFLVAPAAALCVLLGAGIAQTNDAGAEPALRIAGFAGLILIALPLGFSLWGLYFDPAQARDDYRAIAARIEAEAGPEAAVVLIAPNQYEVLTYYYPPGDSLLPVPAATWEESFARIDALAADHSRVYALYWGEWLNDPERQIERHLETVSYPVDSTWYGTVRLVSYAVPAPPADAPTVISGVQFGELITLDGYALSSESLAPGEALGVTLFWSISEKTEDRYKVFVHLIGPDGSLIAQHDAEPGNNLKPTWIWDPGTQNSDSHGLLIPAGTPPGEYTLLIGMYPAFGESIRLPVRMGGDPLGDTLTLATIRIEP